MESVERYVGMTEVVVAIGGKRLLEARLRNTLKAYESRPRQDPRPQPTS
jgi:hypothetical protein